MEEPNIPVWTMGGQMPDETAQALKDEVRKLRQLKKMPVSPEAEDAFVAALVPIVHEFSDKESWRWRQQRIKNLLTQKYPTRKNQKPNTEHPAEELKAAKYSLIAAIAALNGGLNNTAAYRLEQKMLERVGDLEQLGRVMPCKRLPNGRRLVCGLLTAPYRKLPDGWWPLPETYEEAITLGGMRRPETPTIRNLCALLWAVVDIIDPSASPSQWDAKEGLEAQARMSGGESGATKKPLKERFMLDVGRELRKAIGRPPGGPAIKKILNIIFGEEELSWSTQNVAQVLRQEPWPEE